MAQRIESFDWAASPIGPRSGWPATLRLMVDVILNSSFPMLVFWGPELVQIYNDAYVPIFGARHSAALGQRARDCWPEVWDTVGPLLNDTLRTGCPVGGENVPFTLARNGFEEQAHFTFCYSRIGEDEDARGVLCTNVETTKAVLREREFRSMANTIANIVYTQAADGSVEWANARWYDYTQLPDDIALSARAWSSIIPPGDLAAMSTAFERAFVTGEAYEAEIRIKPYGGSDEAYRWHLLRAVPMRGPDGAVLRWAGSATDVHERRVTERDIREQLERDLVREREASLAFQNAALPQMLPTLAGMTFNAMYEAAGEDALVGGDWYDAFRLPDGRVVISVGDVIGNGLAAAVTMSAARQAIRGAAQVFPEPAAVLDAADRALRSEQPDRIVTAFLGILDPLTLTLTYASAGHPPPLLRCADASVVELAGSDLPLGLREYGRLGGDVDIVLPERALLVLYTDGLTESTRDVIEGERRLRAALARPDVYDAPNPAIAIRRAVLSEAGDDVAILTVRLSLQFEHLRRWSFSSGDAETAGTVRRELVELLAAAGALGDETADAEVVFGELIGNVVRHADVDTVEVAIDLDNEAPVLHVLDRGPGFTFYARLPNDSMSESGRGLYLATMLARDISVVPRPGGGSHARAVLAASARAVTRQPNQLGRSL